MYNAANNVYIHVQNFLYGQKVLITLLRILYMPIYATTYQIFVSIFSKNVLLLAKLFQFLFVCFPFHQVYFYACTQINLNIVTFHVRTFLEITLRYNNVSTKRYFVYLIILREKEIDTPLFLHKSAMNQLI